MTRLAALFALLVSAGSAAHAATIYESTVGGFSSNPLAPTVIAAGTDSIVGTGDGNIFDIFRIDGLAPGAQTITFDFAAPAGSGFSYAAGGAILTKETPFAYAWDGITAGYFGAFGPGGADSVSVTLASTFAGPLYLGLYFTYGSNLAYTVSLPPVASVPLPAGALLMLTALGGLAGLGLRRKRRAA